MKRRSLAIGSISLFVCATQASAGFTMNLMLTGYWPPSNEMLRQFSTNPTQNPGGWQGGDWEDRGYNIYSYFPEFTSPPPGDSIGYGDFEVDYQDTSSDFWRITNEIHPLAIITFGRGSPGLSWELEWRYRNLSSWNADYRAPRQPTPSPPDNSVPAGTQRYSSLPVVSIRDAVNSAGLGVSSFIDYSGDAGAFLCEYAGYHAAWYKSQHEGLSDPNRNFAAGHIHVGTSVSVARATSATLVSLRALTGYLDTQIPEPATGALLLGAVLLARRRRGTPG